MRAVQVERAHSRAGEEVGYGEGMTFIIYSTKERDQRLLFYKTEEDKLDLWLMVADFVSCAKEFDKTYEDAQRLLKSIWENCEIGTTQ